MHATVGDWQPAALEAIAGRLGIAASDLSPPRSFWLLASDGTRLHGLDWARSGRPVVLLHGGALSARSWDFVALGLRAAVRPIAVDLRGHGESGWADDYSIERCSADLAAIADELAIARADWVGMSLGGLIAAEFAARNPQRTASLTLVDVAPGVAFAATERMRRFMSTFPGTPSVEAAADLALRESPRSDPDRVLYRMRALLKRAESGSWVWKHDTRRGRDFPELLRRVDALAALARRIRAPFLLVRGARSKILSEAAASAFSAGFADGRWINVSDAGHNVQEDNPAELINALRAFWCSRA